MSALRQVIILLRDTLLVTLAVAGGFMLGGAIGIPGWLQIVCLIPAGYLYIRLSGDPIPPMRRWVPYAVAITVFVSVMSLANGLVRAYFPSLYESSWPTILIFGVAFLPMRSLASFIERHWPLGSSDPSPETKTP
jgi:hypothetical protein